MEWSDTLERLGNVWEEGYREISAEKLKSSGEGWGPEDRGFLTPLFVFACFVSK
jgi:hypothetical protein